MSTAANAIQPILAAVGLGASANAEHVHHPNADHSVAFKGYAAFAKKTDVKPLEYNPQKLADDFVEVAITHCGICGSDIHTIDSGWGPSSYPVIVGHEIVGNVSAIGKDVTHIKVGDRVGIGASCGACLNKKGDCHECKSGADNHCTKSVSTYNTKLPDGQVTQGGYADKYRCDAKWAFPIPESIKSEHAAVLMCGGVTTWAPLARAITKKGMKVGVIGIGGLGHMGIMWASKLNDASAEVTAISHNSNKKEAALKLGATKFLDTSDEKAVKEHARYFDYILCTANGKGQDYANWMSIIKLDGTFCTVGIPEAPISFGAFSVIGARASFTGSLIGSRKEIEDMLKFVDEHPELRPIVEKLPMEKVNEGIQKQRDGKVRFRVVLENPSAGVAPFAKA